MQSIQTISLIGSGNVATQLGMAFLSEGIKVANVWSRSYDNAKTLADKVKANAIENLTTLPECDLVIVAVKDDAIASVMELIPEGIPAAHTSGNTELISSDADSLRGVFYPLQTFTKESPVDWSSIPVCIESNDEAFTERLRTLGETLSDRVELISSAERRIIHVAATIACNFMNHMQAVSEEFMAAHQLEYSLLHPLIKATYENSLAPDIKSRQTGPAVRGDKMTIATHLELLDDNPKLKELYLSITNHITTFHNG